MCTILDRGTPIGHLLTKRGETVTSERYRYTNTQGNVAFIFGALSASALPGPVLVRMLQRLHTTESAARNSLASMRNQGRLEGERHGRVVVYRLGEGVVQKYQDIEGTSGPAPWTGTFHSLIHDIPERHRGFRDKFRYMAEYAGFGLVRPGVLISADDRFGRVEHEITAPPDGSTFFRTTITPPDLAEARRFAQAAWDLDTLAHNYRTVIGLLQQTRDRPAEAPIDDCWHWLDQWHQLYGQILGVQMSDPGLPTELLPSRWPHTTYFEALTEVNTLIGPKLQPILRAEADQLDPGGHCAYYRAPWAPPDHAS